MSSTSPISGSNLPWHIARAYAAAQPAPAARVAASQGASPVSPAGRIGPIGPGATPEPRAQGIDRLVAATVPGKVDFSGSQPAPAQGDPLPFYRHPGDRNEAATFLRLGSGLDVQG